MAKNKYNNTANNSGKKNYYRPPKNKKAVEQNSKGGQALDILKEFNTYKSSTVYSNYYFGLNVFDFYTSEQLSSLVKDPMGNNQILRELSLILYGTNGVYTNTVDYLTAMPTLDRVIVVHGEDTHKKKQNKELMESTLRLIKDKEIIRDALFRGMVEGIAFYYFETTSRPQSNKKMMTDYDIESIIEINEFGINASVISLPVDYTRIVGIKNSSYVLAFNLDYFNIAEGESKEKKLRKYPKEIREACTSRKNNSISENGNWVILDNSKTIVHKIRSKREEKYGRPLVLAAISDILYGDYFTQTKRNVLDEINNKIIYQTFPEGKDKGTSSLTQQQQERQHNTIKGAVLNKNNRGGISFFSVAAGTKINAIEASNTDIFDDKYESTLGDKIALDMGIAGALLNGVGSGSYAAQQQNLELITAQLFQWIEQITAELNKCVSANIINDNRNWVECKYLPITHVNKSNMVGYAKDLYLQGKGSLSLWASACGISPEVFFALLDQEKDDDIENKYPVHKTSYTLSSNDKSPGRPTTDNPTENTIASRANNGNAVPSPSDNK